MSCWISLNLSILFFFLSFYFIFLALLGLHCCVGFSLVAVIIGSSLVPVRELLIAGASLVAGTGFRVCGLQQLWLPGSGAQPQQLSCMGLVAPRHVGASWTRDRTSASCIGRQVLYHWAAREAPISVFLLTKNYCHGVVMEQGMWNTKHIPVMWRISDPC